ncbi:Amidohydrolase 3 [Actinobacteria bacterium OV320]|nr:Amidohydrolase 3 [Actinobacteria bacterium OV320]
MTPSPPPSPEPRPPEPPGPSRTADPATGDPRRLTSRQALHHATLHHATLQSAVAVGLEDRIGRIAPGRRADITLVDITGPHTRPDGAGAAERCAGPIPR